LLLQLENYTYINLFYNYKEFIYKFFENIYLKKIINLIFSNFYIYDKKIKNN